MTARVACALILLAGLAGAVTAALRAFSCDQNDSGGNRMILDADGEPFPPPVWSREDEDEDHTPSKSVVTNTLDPNIWWWRK